MFNFYKFLLITFYIFLNSIAYSDNSNIVYIDIDRIFNNSLVGKSLSKQINTLRVENQNLIKSKEDEIKVEDKRISDQKNILSEEEINKKISNLRDKIKRDQEEIKQSNNNIKNKRNLAMEKILKELKPILADYSKENSISLVLRKKNIIIGKNELDITDDIIQLLNNKIKEIKLN